MCAEWKGVKANQIAEIKRVLSVTIYLRRIGRLSPQKAYGTFAMWTVQETHSKCARLRRLRRQGDTSFTKEKSSMKRETCLAFAFILVLSTLVSCTARPDAPQTAPTVTAPRPSPTEGKTALPSLLPAPTSTDRARATPVPESSETLAASLPGLWRCAGITGYPLIEFLPDGTFLWGLARERSTYEVVSEFTVMMDWEEDSGVLRIKDLKEDSATFRFESSEHLCQRLPPVPYFDTALVGVWILTEPVHKLLGFTSDGKFYDHQRIGMYYVLSGNTVSVVTDESERFWTFTSFESDKLIFDDTIYLWTFHRFPEVPSLAQEIIGMWNVPIIENDVPRYEDAITELTASGKVIEPDGEVMLYQVENNNTIITQSDLWEPLPMLVASVSDQELVTIRDPWNRSLDVSWFRIQP